MKKAVLLGALATVMLVGIVGLAVAGSATFTGASSVSNAGNLVQARATVNPKITMTIQTPDATQTVDFGAVDPEAMASKTATITVSSNKVWDLDVNVTGQVDELGLTTSLADHVGYPKGKDVEYTDTFAINVPWSTEPGTYIVHKQYTLTQQ